MRLVTLKVREPEALSVLLGETVLVSYSLVPTKARTDLFRQSSPSQGNRSTKPGQRDDQNKPDSGIEPFGLLQLSLETRLEGGRDLVY